MKRTWTPICVVVELKILLLNPIAKADEPCRFSFQFPTPFVKLNACRQTDDISSNEPVVFHLPSRFTMQRHVPVPEKATVGRDQHAHV